MEDNQTNSIDGSEVPLEVTPPVACEKCGNSPCSCPATKEVACDKCAHEPCVCPTMPKHPADERLLSAICYIPFMALLTSPLAVIKKPKSAFCEFHASQGLVLFVVWFLSLWVVAIFPSLLVGSVVWLLLLIGSVMGVFKAWSGSEFKIPGLAAIAIHIPVKSLFVAVKKETGIPSAQAPSTDAPSTDAPPADAPPAAQAPSTDAPPTDAPPAAPPAAQAPKEEESTPLPPTDAPPTV